MHAKSSCHHARMGAHKDINHTCAPAPSAPCPPVLATGSERGNAAAGVGGGASWMAHGARQCIWGVSPGSPHADQPLPSTPCCIQHTLGPENPATQARPYRVSIHQTRAKGGTQVQSLPMWFQPKSQGLKHHTWAVEHTPCYLPPLLTAQPFNPLVAPTPAAVSQVHIMCLEPELGLLSR